MRHIRITRPSSEIVYSRLSSGLIAIIGASLILCSCRGERPEQLTDVTLDLLSARIATLRADSTAGLTKLTRDEYFLNIESYGVVIYESKNYVNTITAIDRRNKYAGVSLTADSSLMTRFIELPLDTGLGVTLYQEKGNWYIIDSLLTLHKYEMKYRHRY
jgi:hypothetical protein